MEPATKDMGHIQVEITTLLCQQFDQYPNKVTGGQHKVGFLEDNMIKAFKSRLHGLVFNKILTITVSLEILQPNQVFIPLFSNSDAKTRFKQ